MKKLFLYLSLLISTASLGQNIHIVTQPPNDSSTKFASTQYVDKAASLKTSAFVPLGTLYDGNTWATLGSAWTGVGGVTVSVVANKLNYSAGSQAISNVVGTNNPGTVQRTELNPGYTATMLEKYVFQGKFKLTNTPGSTTYGFGVGTTSNNPIALPASLYAYFNTSTGAGSGTVSIVGGNAFNYTMAVSTNTVPLNNNDYYLLTLERNLDFVIATVRDLTVDTAIAQCSFSYSTTSAAQYIMPNSGYFSVASMGGTFTLDSVNITSNEPLSPNLLLFGDSKFTGFSTFFQSRSVSLLNNMLGGGVVGKGCQSDRTSNMLLLVPEVIAEHPKKVVLELGRNDVYSGVPQYIYGPNIDSIYARLQRAGIDVYILDGIYETALNQDSLKRYIDAKYGLTGTIAQNRVIHTWQPGTVAGSVSGDNVHPSAQGHLIVANTIANFLITRNYAYWLNDVQPKTISNPVYDSMNITGTLHVGTGKQHYYTPQTWNDGDIVMTTDAAITANTTTSANFYNRFVIDNSTNSGMDFRLYSSSASPFTWYTASAGNGTQTQAFQVTGTNIIKTLNAITGNSAIAGDIYIPAGNKISSANSGNAGFETYILLHNSSNNGVEFHNPETGNFRWSTAPVTLGTEVQNMTLFRSGSLDINPAGVGTEDASALLRLTSTTKGILPPRMSTTNKNAITATEGLFLYDNTLHKLGYYDGTSWNHMPFVGQTTLVSGTKAITITGLSSTSRAIVTLVSPSGTSSTIQYQAVCTTNTLTIQANVAAGTINTADGSILNYEAYP